jgi:muramoyltetrapeptide carboxypeptidase
MMKEFVFGLVAPAGPVRDHAHLDRALARMTELGWRYKEGSTIRSRKGFLAADDAVRLQDLVNMYLDEEVTHIWCVRGGYGSSRIVEKFSNIIGSIGPLKPLIGFSDITVLHCCLFMHPVVGNRPGCKGYHGPMLLSLLGRENIDEYSLRNFIGILEKRGGDIDLGKARPMVAGKATGLMVGGNLTQCAALCGTRYALGSPRGEPLILFLEDVGEPPYRLDRCLVQLRQSGLFEHLSGVILGDFDSERSDFVEIQEVVRSHFISLSMPVVVDALIGHGTCNMTLPYGPKVELCVSQDEVTCREILE